MTPKKQTNHPKFTVSGRPIGLHGRTFVGEVVSDRMTATVTVGWDYKRFVPKYQRYEKRRTRVKAHNPKDINAKVGDIVKIMETRPISKTKNFIVVEIMNKEKISSGKAQEKAKSVKIEKPTTVKAEKAKPVKKIE